MANFSKRDTIIRILVLVGVVGLSVLAFIFRREIIALKDYGYPGIFLIEFIANASVFLPIPGSLFTVAAAGILEYRVLLAVLAGTAAALGELFGYAAGRSGAEMVHKTTWHLRVEGWFRRYGGWAIVFLSAIPNPLFDAAGLVAGAAKMPVLLFFLYCLTGKVINRLIIVFGGAWIFSWLPLFHP